MSPPTLARQQLQFLLQTTPNFNPPTAVTDLTTNSLVDLDLVRGSQVLWTAVMKKQVVSYGDVYHWIALTDPGKSPHRFAESSFGDDSEVGGDMSSNFSKIVGLAFLNEFAGATWFKVLRPLWGNTLATTGGPVSISKPRPDDDGPDYLAAPFDPTNAGLGGPFYAVEFKGKKAKVEFNSGTFRSWSSQSTNVLLTGGATGAPVNLKSWVVGFNYGFAQPMGSRELSALLVEDPEIAPGRPLLASERLNASSIIRDHLARQCILLGAPAIAPLVRRGTGFDGVTSLPPVYQIDHPRVRGRRYIGRWYHIDQDGQCLPSSLPSGLGLRGNGIIVRSGKSHLIVHSKDGLVEIFARGSGPGWRGPMDWLQSLLGMKDTIFVGQDATMLRRSIQTSLAMPLDGEPFQDEIQFKDVSGDGPSPSSIRVLQSGSIVVSNIPVAEESAEFWKTP
jgi:hypothetical protein